MEKLKKRRKNELIENLKFMKLLFAVNSQYNISKRLEDLKEIRVGLCTILCGKRIRQEKKALAEI